MKTLKLLCCALMLMLLTSCGILAQVPPDEAVFQAIIQQQIDMQSAVAEGLNMSAGANGSPVISAIPDFEVDKVFIESREKITDSDMKKRAAAHGAYVNELYRVTGTYDATLTKGDQTITQNNPFEVYLGNRPKSMRSTVSAAEAAEMWYLLSPSSAKPV